MVFSGWRAALWLLAALLIVGLVLTAVFWIALLLAVLAAVAWFNLLLLPSVAARLRTPELVLAIALLPVLAAGGLASAGLSGVVAGCSVWVVGVALPRAVMWRLRRRLGHKAGIGLRRLRAVRVIDSGFGS
jgi:hypothetical protein